MFELVIKNEKQKQYILETDDNLYSAISKLEFKVFTIHHEDVQRLPYHLFKNLKSLSIHLSNVFSFPPEMQHLQNLETLDLSNTEFVEFPIIITDLEKLKKISFFQNHLKYIPNSIVKLQHLEVLSFIHCRLKEFPDAILELTNLKELYFSGNEEIIIPSGISNLTNLERLGLHSNKIRECPSSIFNLEKLEFLDLSSNNIKTIPTSIEKLKRLEELILSSNRHMQNCLFLNLPKLERLVIDRHITDIILNEKVEHNILITNGYHSYSNTVRYINEFERVNFLRQMKREHMDTLNICIPDRIKCSICYSLLFFPRVNQQGNIYCKKCIEEHFRENDTDPLTNVVCLTKELFSINIIENEINEFIDNFAETR